MECKFEEDEDNPHEIAKKPRVLGVSPSPNLPPRPKDIQAPLIHLVLKRQKKGISGSSLKAQARVAVVREKGRQGGACSPENSEVSHVSDSGMLLCSDLVQMVKEAGLIMTPPPP